MNSPTPRLRTRFEETMGWVLLLVLLLGCLVILRPFFSALLWAVVLCFSSWPIYRRLLAWVGQRHTIAALLMALAMVLILLVPVLVVGNTLAENVKELTAAIKRWIEAGPPEPPEWLLKVPLIGQSITDYWHSLADNTAKLWTDAKRFVEPVSAALLKLGLLLGGGLLELALSIFIAFFFFRDGAALAERLNTAVERVGGEQGKHLLTVAANTVRGVVYGVLGTALVQAILAGIGYLVAGVPGAGVLALITFFISIIPLLGPAIVWLPAAIWLFHQGSNGWAIFLIIWGLAVNNIEHVLRPVLISKGSDMPFLLIFFGVLGGAAAFGFIGLFLGPTLLAVGFKLVKEWGAASRAAVQAAEAKAMDQKETVAAKGASPS
jgi:predicted PurR-regulated permease PerM